MRSDNETYEAVAKRCDSFSAKSNTSVTNSTSESKNVSCTNCNHFTNNSYCELDLYDQIMVNHDLTK